MFFENLGWEYMVGALISVGTLIGILFLIVSTWYENRDRSTTNPATNSTAEVRPEPVSAPDDSNVRRKAVIPPGGSLHKPMAKYQTARGGWSQARIVRIQWPIILLRRSGTIFARRLN